ncbi:hypothetical protein CLAFUW4_10617 [Fulvia fulva]|uniref:Uncharacterized protein n=1 Tax=Passalora fulva TaxID=5499 RepID=A0A9Q8LGJ6_PASFU|nr:uncharacterized protein CLAFUR5_05230 [Fulvia fulva]KAK4616071.1 hypothetical protein CLAFUR4_10622 [Fulvia fulva]KAK4617329.1 hypothetical protein CLAFUR0_10622 [Fulvia fulva]UJO17090.1 hypothetical protein CLAFUR5_05230 [Fulvia fulva]WPV18973.1 hypothetical protein CLAFUW4_10617 [Fulvia fulva]WPV34541.1 hypothetical protein CLAFUW7_10619 [Fulvia fulva]
MVNNHDSRYREEGFALNILWNKMRKAMFWRPAPLYLPDLLINTKSNSPTRVMTVNILVPDRKTAHTILGKSLATGSWGRMYLTDPCPPIRLRVAYFIHRQGVYDELHTNYGKVYRSSLEAEMADVSMQVALVKPCTIGTMWRLAAKMALQDKYIRDKITVQQRLGRCIEAREDGRNFGEIELEDMSKERDGFTFEEWQLRVHCRSKMIKKMQKAVTDRYAEAMA